MTLQQFITRYSGKKIDWDGAYQGQCVDLFRQYAHEVLKFPQAKGVVGAADFWINYSNDQILSKHYLKVPNAPSAVPLPGDVMIWNKKAGDGFGHIAVYVSGDVNKFKSFDQNWRAINVCEITDHTYTNVYGWLRPVKSTSEPMPDTVQLDKKTFEQLVNKSTSFDELSKAGITTVSQIDELKRALQEARDGKISAEEGAKQTRLELGEFKAKVSEKLMSQQDLGSILRELSVIIDKQDSLQKQADSASEKNRDYEKQLTEAKAEIKRLELLLAGKNPLANASAQQLLSELLKRLSEILSGR
jgi:hypothetical protein